MQRCSAFLPQDRPKFSWILFLMDSLYPIFQTNHPQLLSEAPSKFRNVDWSETIFSQWPQGLIALSDLLTSNLEDRSRDDTDSIHGPVRDIQSQIVLQILGSVAGMAQNYTSWYTKTQSKEVYTSLANAGVIHVLDLALKRPESDIKLDACAVIRRLFGGKSRDQFGAPPPAYRALSFKIQHSGCMESLVELCRSAQSSESSQAILSTVRTLLALTPDPSARRSSWDDAKALVTTNV
ncbi:hypothetical protein B0H11DRAFT_766495 [Mycena galericulata]|nr:hypothetical protein B0H11DRAFT_766495 [Mycena galericulata]